MLIDVRTKIIAGLAAGMLLAGGVSLKYAYEQSVALAQADTATKAGEDHIRDMEIDAELHAAQDAAQQHAAQNAQAQIHTSADAVRTIIRYVPQPAGAVEAPAPVVIQRQDLTAAEQAKVPDAPSYVLETEDEAKATARELIQCDADRSSLAACHVEAQDHAALVVRSLLMAPSTEDWRDWVLHVSDDIGEEIFCLPFASLLGKPH